MATFVRFTIQGEIELHKSGDTPPQRHFKGKGDMHFGSEGKKAELSLEGAYNDTSLDLNWKSELWGGETIKCTSRITKLQDEGDKLDSQLSLEFSQSPHYNLAASWKYQVGSF
jgi:hypothetical protein